MEIYKVYILCGCVFREGIYCTHTVLAANNYGWSLNQCKNSRNNASNILEVLVDSENLKEFISGLG